MFRIGSQPQVQHAAQVSTATSPQGGSRTSTQLDALMKALDQAIHQLAQQQGSSPRPTGGDRVELPTRPSRPGTSSSQDGAHVFGRPTSPTHQPSRPAPDGPKWFPTTFPNGFPNLPGKTPTLPNGSNGHGRPEWAGLEGCSSAKSIAGGTIGTYTEK